MDGQLTMKTLKITSIKNLYIYGTSIHLVKQGRELVSHITKPLEIEDTNSDFPSGYRHGISYYSYYKLLEKDLPLL